VPCRPSSAASRSYPRITYSAAARHRPVGSAVEWHGAIGQACRTGDVAALDGSGDLIDDAGTLSKLSATGKGVRVDGSARRARAVAANTDLVSRVVVWLAVAAWVRAHRSLMRAPKRLIGSKEAGAL
jgi:hypothetical protein